MNITLSAGTYLVDAATGELPRQSFRRLFPLSLPTGGQAQTLYLTPATRLQGKFLPLTFNARAAGAVVPALLANQGGGVRVSLNLPLRLERVTFANGVTGAITVHRVDGAAIAEQPTTGQTIINGQITLTEAFTDRQFILKRTDGSLNAGQITELWFTSYPTTPRFGLLDQGQSPAGLIPLWQTAGQLTTGGADGDLNLSMQDFQPLERYLAGQSLAADIALTLVAESDAPCRFQLSQTTLSYRLSYQGFSPGSPEPAKQVLRFQGADLRPQTLALTVPPQVRAASLAMSLSLSSTPQSADLLPTTRLTAPTQRQGVEILPQQWVGQRFTPPTAIRLSGVTLGLLLRPSTTTLTLELQTDDGGQPAGLIAQTTLITQGTAQPQWVTATFPQPAVLYTQPYWLLISASQPALWLTQPGVDDVFLLDHPDQSVWSTRHRYPQTQGLAQLLSPVTPPTSTASSPPPARAHPAVALQIGNVTLPSIWDPERDQLTVDLMAGLVGASSAVTLTIVTATPGLITLYAPKVDYE